MKIPPAEVDNFITKILKPQQDIVALMLYGPDLGLVKERAKYIANYLCNNANFTLVDINFEQLVDLHHLLYSKNLAKTKKLIKISNIGASLPKEIGEMISEYRGKNFILIEAQDLSPSSILRKFFEKSTNAACIACYEDEPLAVKNLIIKTIKKYDLQISQEALQIMSNAIAGDRMLILNNINKLITYMGDKKQISADDVLAIVETDRDETLDELCQCVANKNAHDFCKTLGQLLAQNVSLIAVLRSLGRYFLRIYQVKLKVAQNLTITSAMQELAPPVFFKQVNAFKLQVQNWQLVKLASLLNLLLELEIKCKKTHTLNEVLLEYELLQFINSR
jgi:DNA polymerase-3 subunit delta